MDAQPRIKTYLFEDYDGLELSEFHHQNVPDLPIVTTGYNFGVRLKGVKRVTYHKQSFVSQPNALLIYHPDNVLYGKPLTTGTWHYRDMTFLPALLNSIFERERLAPLPFFPTAQLEDRKQNSVLVHRFLELHSAFTNGVSKLERDSKLILWLSDLILLTLGQNREKQMMKEHRSVKLAKDYLQAHFTDTASLEDLAALTGLSKYHLLTVFKRDVGVSPHHYQISVRIHEAKRLLRQGVLPSKVALEVGFYDQSRLNQWFKRYMFVTPREYQRGVSRF